MSHYEHCNAAREACCSENYAQCLGRLRSAAKDGDHAQALRLGRAMLDEFGEKLPVLRVLGSSALKTTKPQLALAYYERALGLESNTLRGLESLAQARLATDDAPGSQALYQEIVRAYRNNPGLAASDMSEIQRWIRAEKRLGCSDHLAEVLRQAMNAFPEALREQETWLEERMRLGRFDQEDAKAAATLLARHSGSETLLRLLFTHHLQQKEFPEAEVLYASTASAASSALRGYFLQCVTHALQREPSPALGTMYTGMALREFREIVTTQTNSPRQSAAFAHAAAYQAIASNDDVAFEGSIFDYLLRGEAGFLTTEIQQVIQTIVQSDLDAKACGNNFLKSCCRLERVDIALHFLESYPGICIDPKILQEIASLCLRISQECALRRVYEKLCSQFSEMPACGYDAASYQIWITAESALGAAGQPRNALRSALAAHPTAPDYAAAWLAQLLRHDPLDAQLMDLARGLKKAGHGNEPLFAALANSCFDNGDFETVLEFFVPTLPRPVLDILRQLRPSDEHPGSMPTQEA